MDYLAFFATVSATAAIGVVIIQQILKSKIIPLSFANKYPVPTLIVLSIVAAIVATFTAPVVLPTVWWGWVLLVFTIATVAAIIYNNVFKHWDDLRATEGYTRE